MTYAPTFRCLSGLTLAAALLASAWGCKPSATPAAAQDQPRTEIVQPLPGIQHPPGNDDLARFLRGRLPLLLKLAEVKSDPPAPLPGTASGGNAWIYNVRLTFAPAEDVLGPPAPHHAAVFREAMDDLDELTAWSAAYARSPYAGRYPSLRVDSPVPAHPKFLAVLHAKDQPYPPLYWKMRAEWQVDHWNYTVTDAPLPANDGGTLRSGFSGPFLIQGSQEAEQFLAKAKASIDAAKTQRAAIEAAYCADLLQATAPGVLYRGQLRHQGKFTAAEVRFAAPPAGTESQQTVQLEVRLPDAADESFTYLVRRAERLPLSLFAPTTDAARVTKRLPAALSRPVADTSKAANNDAIPTLQKAAFALTGDLKLSLVKASGKQTYNGTVPDMLLQITRTNAQPASVTLQVRDGHLEGRLSGASTDASGFVLSAQQSLEIRNPVTSD